ncbi:31909_t:CDS:2 [Gigaspora margarita]|uniref:31909_t:CDS:1 n=1 Tax=Gigaspora margarita TaxID=4874 RepID=A0ABN7UQL3_GIGMA|nr:31909_t:CDS:2 [Gigaspora margarita]
MIKKHNTRSKKKKQAQIASDLPGLSKQALKTESNQHSNQSSDDTEPSISFNLSQEQSETTIIQLKVPEIEILINNADKFTNKKPSASWVWGYMKKDKLKNEITCDIVTILDGNEKNQYGKNSKEQAVIELDKSTLTILSILSKNIPNKWPLLDDSEPVSDNSIEFMPKQSIISPQLTSQIQSTLPMQSISVQSQTRLLHLQDAVKQLARSLCYYPELQQRKDGQNLSKKLLLETEWEELNELTLLLELFAQTTKLIGGAQYPTLGMMLSTISLLLSYLH